MLYYDIYQFVTANAILELGAYVITMNNSID